MIASESNAHSKEVTRTYNPRQMPPELRHTVIAKVDASKIIHVPVPMFEEGQEIEVMVRAKPSESGPQKRVFGSARGSVHMSDDFDEPLEDFADYM
jgi:hypothetical protein